MDKQVFRGFHSPRSFSGLKNHRITGYPELPLKSSGSAGGRLPGLRSEKTSGFGGKEEAFGRTWRYEDEEEPTDVLEFWHKRGNAPLTSPSMFSDDDDLTSEATFWWGRFAPFC